MPGKKRSPFLLLRPATGSLPPDGHPPLTGARVPLPSRPPSRSDLFPQAPHTGKPKLYRLPHTEGSPPHRGLGRTAPGARSGAGRKKGRSKVEALTVALLARRPQPTVKAGGPTQAAGRDLARGLLPLPQDVQAAEGGTRHRPQGQSGPRLRLRLRSRSRSRSRIGRCCGPAAALHPLTGRGGPGRRAGCRGRGEGRRYSNGAGSVRSTNRRRRTPCGCSQWGGRGRG